ncbi:MAG: histidine kinase dimerization/phosphoacceptor domain -containing protein, partial [Balneolaceae bacterium]
IILSVLMVLVWKVHEHNLERSLEDKVLDTSQLVVQQFRGVLFDNINTLKNLKHRLEITNGSYFDYWNKDAARIIAQDPSFHFVEWIDSTGVIQLVEPLRHNRKAVGLDITTLDYRYSDWKRSRRDSVFNLTHWIQLVQGNFAFLVDAPVYIKSRFQGSITAGIDPAQRFNDIMQGLDDYHVRITDEKGTVFYTYGDSVGTKALSHFGVSTKITIGDATQSVWTVTIVPNHLFYETNSMGSSRLNLVLGLVLCFLVSVSFYFAQKSSASQKAQKAINKKLRSLIDASPLAICIINTDGIVTDFWNEAAEQMFGWKREEVIGNFIPFIREENIEEFERSMHNCIKEGGLKNQEVTRKRKDGSKGIFLLNVGMISGHEQMLVLIEDITEVKQYQKELKRSLTEKEFLLSEIHHRVKNNLAIIAGLIELQKDRVSDRQIANKLNETQNRIYSISGVHELLYEADNFAEINLEKYVDKLLDRLQQTYQDPERGVIISKELDNFSVNINQAVPLGLLLNELITNSFKHAFEKTEHPRITLKLKKSGRKITIIYRDNGKGIDDAVLEDISSLGINLIKNLLSQLNAKYELEDSGSQGFGISFTFQTGEKGSHSNIKNEVRQS